MAEVVTILGGQWRDALASLVATTRKRLLIASPFISDEGARFVVECLTPGFRASGACELITDLSPAHIADGSLDPGAVIAIASAAASTVRHLPGLHAKVYVSDIAAIVTSGNLTASALYRNIECGVLTRDPASVSEIHALFDDHRATGGAIPMDGLRRYAAIATEVRDSTVRQREAGDPRLRAALNELSRRAEDELTLLRLAGEPVHAVFVKTIRHLLATHGPLTTDQLHAHVQRLHPDLCDDNVDRVINGESFGKKWKHAVRTAQQRLKETNAAMLEDGRWSLTPSDRA